MNYRPVTQVMKQTPLSFQRRDLSTLDVADINYPSQVTFVTARLQVIEEAVR